MSNAALSFDVEASALLESLCVELGAKTGLVLTQANWVEMRRAIATIASECGCADWMSCLRLLTSSASGDSQQKLIDHLTIGETYFFRDGALFTVLREKIFPELIAARRDRGNYLRIWSAGCCSGEEPYSVAIELLRLLPDWHNWQITLLATDINRRFLQKAERGVYEPWSLRHKPIEPYAPYLLPLAKGRFEVASVLRELVTFEQLNFASHLYPSILTNTQRMDIILCRNALMYLQPACIQDVIARLSDCLAEGGWFITSTVEASLVQRPELHAVRLPEIVLFRKQTVKASAAAPLKIEKPAPNETGLGQHYKAALIKPEKISAAATHATFAAPVAFVAPASKTSVSKENNHPPSGMLEQKASLTTARALADQGLLAAACTECEKVLAVDKLNIDASFLHANILLELGATKAAEKALQRTLYLDEEHIVAHVALATVFQQAILFYQSSLLEQAKGREEAQRHWRSALRLLQKLPDNEIVRDSDGLTAKQMREMVNAMLADELTSL